MQRSVHTNRLLFEKSWKEEVEVSFYIDPDQAFPRTSARIAFSVALKSIDNLQAHAHMKIYFPSYPFHSLMSSLFLLCHKLPIPQNVRNTRPSTSRHIA